MFNGAFTALVTPFRNGEVDVEALEGLVEFQIAQGIHGLVPCGPPPSARRRTGSSSRPSCA